MMRSVKGAARADTVVDADEAGRRALGPDDSAATSGRSVQVATLVFVAVLAVALVLYLVFGRRQWFFLDEWDFLAARTGHDLNELFRPHNEHWVTLPILVYRVLWRLFGLRTYVPYQLIAILLHLTAAVLLRVVMRRAGVHPWIATAAASLFALFGAGARDIVWAFQMVWGASLVLGLTHLILADHDGPIDRRDALGLLAGLAGMLCSGVAVTMILVVGLSALVRRGWRAALFHTVPLGLLYIGWWIAFARDRYSAAGGSIGTMLRFAWTGLGAAFGEMGQLPGAGLALGALLISGLFLAWHGLDWNDLRRRAAAPGALLVGALVFLASCRARSSVHLWSAIRAVQSLPACRCGPLSPCRCGRGRRLHASLARARLGRLRAPPRGHSREHRSHRQLRDAQCVHPRRQEADACASAASRSPATCLADCNPCPTSRPGSRSDGCSTASQPVVYRSLATSLPSPRPMPACACHCPSPTARLHARGAHCFVTT